MVETLISHARAHLSDHGFEWYVCGLMVVADSRGASKALWPDPLLFQLINDFRMKALNGTFFT